MAESEGQSGKAGVGGTGKAGDQSTSPALAVIELFGGIRPMAKDLGVAVSTVQGWKERESIPANRHDQIRAAAGKKGLTLDAELLRAAALPGGGSGQPPVIEGEVQKPTSASESKPAPSTSADKQAEKPAEKTPEKTSSAGAATATQSSAASRASQAARPAAGAAPAASGGRGSMVNGLALGFALAVVVAVGTIYTRELWQPLFGSGGAQENAAVTEALQALDQRLTALQAELPPDNSAALSDLNERLATLEAAVSQGAGQDPETRAALESLSANLAGLSDRIQEIEDRMQSIEDGQAAAIAPTAALSDRLSGEAARLDELLTAQSELQARLDATEQDLAGTIARRDAAPGSQETLLLLAALQLRDAIRGSGPYEEPLRMLQNL
uniref:carph-isopro domain-containing protein n=1 Tax=Pelagibius sp. TaxID=1931238 RepID=UPI00345FE9C1